MFAPTSLEARLDRLSIARRLVESLGFAPEAIELAVQPGATGTVRHALPFQLEPLPVEAPAPGASVVTVAQGRAGVSNVLNALLPMPSASFAYSLALLAGAEDAYYRDAVADAQQAASDAPPVWLTLGAIGPAHPAVRAEIDRVFALPASCAAVAQSTVTYTCRVMGHGLTRLGDRYVRPGTGAWTLLRGLEPGDGFIALNLAEGWGEFFACGDDAAALHFAHTLAGAIA